MAGSGRLIGTALGSIDGRRKGWINRVTVDPDDRRRGLGLDLIEHVEAALHARGALITAVLVERANSASIDLFRKAGYETMDVVYLRKPNHAGA